MDTFGSNLLAQLPASSNAVISPYSIFSVLAMARAGAKDQTAAQIDSALGTDQASQAGDITAIDDSVAAAVAAGAAAAGSGQPLTVDAANSVWTSPSLQVHQSYLNTLARDFGVGMYQIDYTQPEIARAAINAWVAQHTANLVPELMPIKSINAQTVMTLVNALSLSASWAEPFTVARTPITFTPAAGSTVQSPAITTTGPFVHASGAGWVSVTIPYRGSKLAMTLVVPDKGSFDSVGRSLSADLSASRAGTSGGVSLTMPKFKITTHTSLVPILKTLGVTDVFGASADLSGIAGAPGDLRVGDVQHQAVITVDENGTEAAAATAATIQATSALAASTSLVVDRPFFFAISDTATGAPLFLGQVTNPLG